MRSRPPARPFRRGAGANRPRGPLAPAPVLPPVPLPVPPALRPALLALLLPLLLLSGVAGSAAAQEAPHLVAQPIDAVLASPIDLRVGDDGTAVLEVTTSVPLACVVVYGPDDAFGRLALDQGMGDSAHADHRVLLTGLEPDREYRYRLQGSAEDGTFYASTTLAFRTPAAADRDPGVNAAAAARGGRVTGVSSVFGTGWEGVNAIDGDAATAWSSAGDGDGATLTVELAERSVIVGFGLWTRTMGSSAQIHSFEVEADDGRVYGPFGVPDADGMHRFAAEGEGRRFTFRVLESSGGNTGAVEVAVYTER